MTEKVQLPEGYTPLDYIEYHPKQETMFVFGEFDRFKEALDITKRINTSCGEDVCDINSFQTNDNVLFSVVFPERVFDKVDYIKREECNIFVFPTEVIYNTPVLYRFLEEKYVDSFMKTGVLKLTTFDKCKTLEDANRKDESEGRSELYGYDGKYKLQIGFGVGSDVIMLCTSLCSDYRDSSGKVYKKYIEIFDVQGLLFSIADQLKKNGFKVKSIMFGPCFYTKKEFHNAVNSEAFREKLDKEQRFDWDEMMKLANSIGGYNMYFQKPIEKRSENEFRLLWIVDEIKKDQEVFVTVPNPERYCKIIDSNN